MPSVHLPTTGSPAADLDAGLAAVTLVVLFLLLWEVRDWLTRHDRRKR